MIISAHEIPFPLHDLYDRPLNRMFIIYCAIILNKNGVTHRTRAHGTLVAWLGWQVMLGEGLARLIDASIISAQLRRSSQACRDLGLV